MAAKKDGETPEEPAALPEPKRCFFIAPIGTAGSEIRKRSDQVFKHILTPICAELAYHLIRADRIAEAGMITTQVVEHLINDELVVADLTGRNPNVFYELAIRHVTRKPMIQLMGVDEDLPFDVAAMRTVFLDVHDLDSVAAAKEDIADQIRSFDTGKLQMTTPISHALDWEKLRSGDPEQRTLAELTITVSQLVSEVRGMGRGARGNPFSEAKLPSSSAASESKASKRRFVSWFMDRYPGLTPGYILTTIQLAVPPSMDWSDRTQWDEAEALVLAYLTVRGVGSVFERRPPRGEGASPEADV